MNKNSYHVVPRKKGGWDIKRQNDFIPVHHFATQNEAINVALKLCRDSYSMLFVHWPREGVICARFYPDSSIM